MTKEQMSQIRETMNSIRGGLDDLDLQLETIRKENIARKLVLRTKRRATARVIPISHAKGSSLTR